MMTLNDGRSELWQWDTNRKLTVDAECSQVHFSNKVFGRSIDVDVVDGVAIIPDILLQTDKDLNVWAFVGTAENGYTKISKTFMVNRRNKPSDYVFTPVEQTTIAEIAAIAQSVRDDADAGLFDGSDGKNPVYGVDYGTPDQIADIANQAAGILADDIQNISDGKVDKVEGMGLSTNDYDNAAKAKVDAIPEDPKYTDTVYDDTEVKQNLSQIKDDLAYLAEVRTSRNLLDKSKLIRGLIKGYGTDIGTIIPDETSDYYCYPFIPVEEGQFLHLINVTVEGVTQEEEIQWLFTYDANKSNPIRTTKAKAYQIQSGVSFVQLCIHKSVFYVPRVMISVTDSEDIPVYQGYFATYLKYPGINTHVHINAADGLDSYLNTMLDAFGKGDCDVHLHGGDIVYTNEFVDQIRSLGMRGVPIGNGCRYYFDTGTRIICEYTGNNAADVKDYFSPLDTWNLASDYEIYNLDLIAKNVVYALHDEANGFEQPCKHLYKDCHLSLDNSALGDAGNGISKCIGGGLGLHSEIIIEDCMFNTVNPMAAILEDVSYHKANRQDYTDAKIIVTGCWFSGRLRFDTNYDIVPDIVPRIIATGNSAMDISAYQCNAKIWGNEIRTE